MKTKIIPFDLETAKKIQAGEIEGKIKTRCGCDARILCTDLIGQAQPVLVAFLEGNGESVSHYTKGGQFYINGKSHEYDLVLEVPDNEPQFKPFDKVLVYNRQNGKWFPNFFSHIASDGRIVTITNGFYESDEVVNYEGNEHFTGTTNKPKEE